MRERGRESDIKEGRKEGESEEGGGGDLGFAQDAVCHLHQPTAGAGGWGCWGAQGRRGGLEWMER